jgi:signal peptidase II
MLLGQEFRVVGDWFIIHFVENQGMAFGLEWGGEIGKYFLTSFRILAAIAMLIYLSRIIKQKRANSLIISISMIFAGAVGNIIDSVFYGRLFTQSTYHQVATFLPEEGGYTNILLGKVVDMLYFPLFSLHIPDFIPFIGGEIFNFFQPVFNIADASVTVGVSILLLFNRRFLQE